MTRASICNHPFPHAGKVCLKLLQSCVTDDFKDRLSSMNERHVQHSDMGYTALLTPGLSAAVEIKTGKRSVLSYLLSPIARSVSEAGRER